MTRGRILGQVAKGQHNRTSKRQTEKNVRGHSQDLLVALENDRHPLKVHAVKAVTVGISKLDGIVFEAPLAALQGYDFIDLLEEIGNRGIVLKLDAEDDADLGELMAADDQAEPKIAALHSRLSVAAHLGGQRSRVR